MQLSDINKLSESVTTPANDLQPELQVNLEHPISLPSQNRSVEELPSLSGVEYVEKGLFRVEENKERETFCADFSFEMAGVVLNGRTSSNVEKHEGIISTNGDRLASRLLPLLNENTAVRFVYSGGGETPLLWSISGIVQNAISKASAISVAKELRQSLQMVLASESSYRFVPKVFRKVAPVQEPVSMWATRVVPRGIVLTIPTQTILGFDSTAYQKKTKEETIRIAVPAAGHKSFKSLAEAVVLNPNPIVLAVSFNRISLDATSQTIVNRVLKWMQHNPGMFPSELDAKRLELGLAESVQAQLREWLNHPAGARVECYVLSQERLSDSLFSMVGGDVFGAQVDAFTRQVTPGVLRVDDGEATDVRAGLDMSCCLRAGSAWPSLFPSFDSIPSARVHRIYNNITPTFTRDGVLMGCVAENQSHSVRLTDSARCQHTYFIGGTGTGKSTVLFNMILQDIRADRGVGVIDPHGDLYDQLLEAIPQSKAKNVVLFNPGSFTRAPGINPLECSGSSRSMQVNFAINELLKTFERLYDMRTCGGPMFEMYFRNAVLLLMESDLEEATLTEVSLVLEDSDYRNFLKARCKNQLVVGFWENVAEKTYGELGLKNISPYISSKINSFTCNALMRSIIGQSKSTIDFQRVIDNRQILLIKLSKGILGELDTKLLGSFLLSKIFATAMGRATMKSTKRSPFHLVVDEFQNFTNDTVANMLGEARKYGLFLTLANQNLSQLEANQGSQNVLDAVLGNVGNLITFRVGPQDAEKLRRYTEPEFGCLDLQGLPNYHAIGRLMTTQGLTRPFVFRTFPAATPRRYTRAKQLVWERREKSFTTPTAEVEAQIIRRREVHKAPKAVEGRKSIRGDRLINAIFTKTGTVQSVPEEKGKSAPCGLKQPSKT